MRNADLRLMILDQMFKNALINTKTYLKASATSEVFETASSRFQGRGT